MKGKLMIRGYSRNRPVFKDGVLQKKVYVKRIPPDGCIDLDKPSFTICAAGPLTLWYIPSDISQ